MIEFFSVVLAQFSFLEWLAILYNVIFGLVLLLNEDIVFLFRLFGLLLIISMVSLIQRDVQNSQFEEKMINYELGYYFLSKENKKEFHLCAFGCRIEKQQKTTVVH